MDEPAVGYLVHRAPQLAAAMVAAAAVTLPRQEGALRGSLEAAAVGAKPAPIALMNSVTAAAAGAAADVARDATLTESAIQTFALHLRISAATAGFGQLAHAICSKRLKANEE